MRSTNLMILLIAFMITGCATIRPKKIVFNKEKGIYEYRFNRRVSITLRNEHQQLVDTTNYEKFRDELDSIKNHYPYRKRLENDGLLRKSDFRLASLYGSINQLIIAGEYQKSLDGLKRLTTLYPEIYEYSDGYFLKGTAFEKLGLADSAKIMYGQFLKYSSQKFSARFRGHRDDDLKDSNYSSERKYATNYLLDRKQTVSVSFTPIQPKYYFGSFQPGYTLNREDQARNSKGILTFLFGNDLMGDLTGGYQYYYPINERFNINPGYATSGNMTIFSLAAPIQLYKSRNNNFGLKFTPFVNYLSFDSLIVNQHKYRFNEHFLNFGARISAGYYPIEHLAIGAYYQTNFYNEANRFYSKKYNIELWIYDDYDVSLYYNIFKGFSLKSGIKNDDLVAGIYWYGWEISYDITRPGLILKVDMY